MRTSRRLFLVVVLPTATVGLTLLSWRVAQYYAERDEPELQNANAIQEGETRSYAEHNPQDPPFSEDARRQEVESLRNSVNQLDASISQVEGEASTRKKPAASQRAKVERSIAALSEADSETWRELREKAREDLTAYAESLGERVSAAAR